MNTNLKKCRLKEKIKQEQLGEIMGVKRTTISGWETGNEIIPLHRLIFFSNKFGYSIDYILKLSSKETKYYNHINTNKEKVAKKLKIIRTNSGLNKTKFAKSCNVSRTTYGSFENGRYLINTNTLYLICKTYKVSADWVLGRSYNMFLD